MDALRFDKLARALDRHTPRRTALGALGGGLAALLTRVGLDDAAAKKGKKNRKKPKLNEYGCVNVGGKCRGKDALCCSGICQGKKPKKGKKDKSKCVAHHVGGCPPGANSCMGGISCGTQFGNCYQTTGQASFCGGGAADCNGCTTDVECEAAHGPGAACIACTGGCGPGTGNTFCLKAAA